MMGTFVVLAGLLVIVFLSVRSMVRQKNRAGQAAAATAASAAGAIEKNWRRPFVRSDSEIRNTARQMYYR